MLYQCMAYYCEQPQRVEMLSELLALEGIQVDVFGDRDSLLSFIASERPKLVLLDHSEWRKDVRPLVKELRIAQPEPFGIICVIDQKISVAPSEWEEIGIDAVLETDFELEALFTTCRRLLYPYYQRGERRTPRIQFAGPLKVSVFTPKGKKVATRVKDLSLGGVRLEWETSTELPIDHVVKLEIATTEDQAEMIEATAITRWCFNDTLGLEFYEIDRSRLKKMLEGFEVNQRISS